jgi:acetyltransferase-like isoleucine patch superfamily enzyme
VIEPEGTSVSEQQEKTIAKTNVIREKLASGEGSPFQTYKALTIGDGSLRSFVRYEVLTSLLGPLPGAAGYLLRKIFYRKLFAKVGRGLIIGRNVVIRHPGKISIGDNVTIDNNSIIDGRGSGEKGIVLEDNVLVNRNCMILAKTGPIHIGKKSSIGSNSVIVSISGVRIGESVLTAGGLYISAGSYRFDNPNIPIMEHDAYSTGPVEIGDGAWMGTRVTLLDGVTVGRGAIVGACSMVNKIIPPFAIAVGTPAKVIRMRK